MKITLLSDLHTELEPRSEWYPVVPAEVEVIILAGDIGTGAVTEWITELSNRYPKTNIVVVAGNHEFYHTKLEVRLEGLHSDFSLHQRIHFLEKSSIVLGGVRFLGCTLWADFRSFGDDTGSSAKFAEQCVNDFKLINLKSGERLSAHHMAHLHRESVIWLERELGKSFEGKTVVVTHFPPALRCAHGNLARDQLSPYFVNNLEWLIERHWPVVWCYGHNHWNTDTLIYGCRVISNQLGYPHELADQIGFQESVLIEV